jgi:anti-sigma factor RsiW
MDTDLPPDLTCQELVELVTDYLDGTLPPAEARRFAGHLEACEGCRIHLVQMRRTIALVGALTEESIPRPALDELLAAFRDWRSGIA